MLFKRKSIQYDHDRLFSGPLIHVLGNTID
jgi:hypothetical protein